MTEKSFDFDYNLEELLAEADAKPYYDENGWYFRVWEFSCKICKKVYMNSGYIFHPVKKEEYLKKIEETAKKHQSDEYTCRLCKTL